MKTNTQIEINLTIKDISSIYSKNFNIMIIQQIKELYEGRCMDNQYIVSIDSIVKRSLPNLIKRDLDAKIRIFVIVAATTIRYDKYDTITNMNINKIIPKGKIGSYDLLECSNDHCKALIKLDDRLPEFKIGDTIPIKVGTIMFKINHKQVLVNAYPFVPHNVDLVAYTIPKLSNYEKDQIKSFLIPLIESHISKKSGLDQNRWKYFNKLVYSFKSDQSKKSIGKQVDVISFLQNIDNYAGENIMIDPKISLSSLKLSVISNSDIDKNNITLVADNLYLTKLIFTYTKHLNLIAELSSIYASDTMFDNHQYIWDLYEKNKF
jgi:hypothetical protein